MEGIRIWGKNVPRAKVSGIDFEFADILRAIEPYIRNLYWAFSDDLLWIGPRDLSDDEEERYYQERANWISCTDEQNDALYTKQGFLEKYGQHIGSDWVDICGYQAESSLCTFDPINSKSAEGNAEIYFSCIDAAFWEVYAQNPKVIESLENTFKHTARVLLKDKKD